MKQSTARLLIALTFSIATHGAIFFTFQILQIPKSKPKAKHIPIQITFHKNTKPASSKDKAGVVSIKEIKADHQNMRDLKTNKPRGSIKSKRKTFSKSQAIRMLLLLKETLLI